MHGHLAKQSLSAASKIQILVLSLLNKEQAKLYTKEIHLKQQQTEEQ